MTYKTEQESFWAGEFGDDYIDRNNSSKLLASNLNFFVNALNRTRKIKSCIEFGANIGMNLKAINLLFPEIKMTGIEINEQAYKSLVKLTGKKNAYNQSIFDFQLEEGEFDLSIVKGVLIHINPDMIPKVYEKLYEYSRKYILIAEYYNPSPVKIEYRGHKNKLFKRDFAGEFMDKYNDVELLDYGFVYHKDTNFPQDDITWFLLKKI